MTPPAGGLHLSTATIWTVILVLGVGTYLIRYSFLGLAGRLRFPDWLLRHLRYAPFAVIPGLVLPMLVPQDGGAVEPLRLTVAVLVIIAGWLTRNTLVCLIGGAAVYFTLHLAGIG